MKASHWPCGPPGEQTRSIRDGVSKGFLAPSRADPWNLGLGWVALLEPSQGLGCCIQRTERARAGRKGFLNARYLMGLKTLADPQYGFHNIDHCHRLAEDAFKDGTLQAKPSQLHSCFRPFKIKWNMGSSKNKKNLIIASSYIYV